MDVCAAGLKAAAAMVEDGALEEARNTRYARWDDSQNAEMLKSDLSSIEARVRRDNINPDPRSGRQERLENLVNRYL